MVVGSSTRSPKEGSKMGVCGERHSGGAYFLSTAEEGSSRRPWQCRDRRSRVCRLGLVLSSVLFAAGLPGCRTFPVVPGAKLCDFWPPAACSAGAGLDGCARGPATCSLFAGCCLLRERRRPLTRVALLGSTHRLRSGLLHLRGSTDVEREGPSDSWRGGGGDQSAPRLGGPRDTVVGNEAKEVEGEVVVGEVVLGEEVGAAEEEEEEEEEEVVVVVVEEDEAAAAVGGVDLLLPWPSGKEYFPPIHVKVERELADNAQLGTRSKVYVNDTECNGVLNGSSGIPLKVDHKPGDELHFTMLGEFYSERPGYLHMHPSLVDGDTSRLWITDFGMVGNGGVVGIDVTGKRQASVCSAQMPWPNAVEFVPANTWKGLSKPGILVADGFLVPGKTNGAIFCVTEPGTDREQVSKLTSDKKQFFYHKAIPFEIDGHHGVLTARACKPVLPWLSAEGELVWLEKPDANNPIAAWNTPWREVVLAKGPDVMFDVVDLDPLDGTVEVFAAEFFARRLSMMLISWDDRIGAPRLVERQVIDSNLGQAYSVQVVNLSGPNSHILVTTHEDAAAEDEPEESNATSTLMRIGSIGTGMMKKKRWTYSKLPSSLPKDSRSLNGSNRDKKYEFESPVEGGKLLAYKIPSRWQFRQTEEAFSGSLSSLFSRVSCGQGGRVDMDGFDLALSISELEIPPRRASELFNEADWEGSGTIDLLEFKSAMLSAYREYKKAGITVVGDAVRAVAAVADGGVKIKMERAQFLKSLPRVFYRIDTDGSGSIDMAEMRTAMQDCGVECTDVEMASMFIEADVDGDGSIDFAEFSSLMTNLYSGQSDLGPQYTLLKGLSLFESALREQQSRLERLEWERTTIACGFRVKRVTINPGAPGFAYPFHPHKSMRERGDVPHILLAGDCADAAYLFRPVPMDKNVHYELMATFGFEGTVGSIAVEYCDTVDSADDGWAKFFIGVYEKDRVYMFKCGPPPIPPPTGDWAGDESPSSDPSGQDALPHPQPFQGSGHADEPTW